MQVRRTRVRTALAVGTSALFLVALGACSTGGDDAADGSETVTIWSWRTEDQAAMDEIFDVFEEENPGITVSFETIPDADYQNKITPALQGGKGPDIAQLKAYGQLQPLIDGGFIDPLDELVPELLDFPDSTKIGISGLEDGLLYGVPYSVPNMGVFYNTTIFADNGIEVPTTYDEFLAACDTLLAAGVIPIAAGGANGSSWALEINVATISPNLTGPEFYDDLMAGKTDLTDPKFVEAMQRTADLLPYYSPGFAGVDYTAATQQFINGEAAMFFGGSWENGSFRAQGGDDLKFSLFPFPADVAGDPVYTSNFVDGSYGLTTDSEHKDAAVEVLNFMASQEFAQLFADKLGWPPARNDVTIDENDPALAEMMTMQESSMPYVTLVGYKWGTPTASSIFQPALIDMITGKIAPADLAAQMQDGVDEWFEANKY
jgi:raffinose/stachyose/melibiose transport system substrate-binding protein